MTAAVTRKPPGRVRRAAALKREAATRAAAPYIVTYGGALAVSGVADLAAGVPSLPPLPVAVAAAALAHGGVKLWENHGWHRSGGKAAMRQRRKYQGWAGRRDIARLARLGPGRTSAPLVLGTAKGRTVSVHREKSVLYYGPPGCGKTSAMACHAADAPGVLFATSTKTELLLDSAPYRDGRLWILNADGYGGIPSNLAWSPTEGCEARATAMRRAGDLMAAAPHDPSGKDAHWDGLSKEMLQYLLKAAALLPGGNILTVEGWAASPLMAQQAADLLVRHDPRWGRALVAMITNAANGDARDWSAISQGVTQALAWVKDDAMEAAACPRPGEGFSAREFARSNDSVYLIGKKRPHGSLAPYFAALGAEIFEQLKIHAMETPSGRLPVPATYVLDEMPLTCPIPVHDMLAEARGYEITITAGFQSLSQLRSVWGKDDGDTIRSAAAVEVIFGGEKRLEDLAAISGVIGPRDTWTRTKDDGGHRVKQPGSEPLMSPEALHRLAPRRAVILAPACKPVLIDTPAIWERRGHVRADLSVPVGTPAAQLAITSGARTAIPMPGAQPQPVAGTPPVPALSGPAQAPDPIPDYPPCYPEETTQMAHEKVTRL